MTANLVLVLVFIGIIIFLSTVKGHKKKRIVFFGDSITQMGAERGGYIDCLDQLMKQRSADANYALIGAGISGNKVYDLYLRAEEDVLSQAPYITVIYIGINDVWHKVDYGTGTSLADFEKFYRALIKKLQYNGSQIVLCTPTVIGEKPDGQNVQDEDLNMYSHVVRNMAKELGLYLVDLRTVFMNYYSLHNTDGAASHILTTDGVHLNKQGNQIVAEAMWQVLQTIK